MSSSPRMFRAQYRQLALNLSITKPLAEEDIVIWENAINAMLPVIGKMNPLFDKDQFLDACNYEGVRSCGPN